MDKEKKIKKKKNPWIKLLIKVGVIVASAFLLFQYVGEIFVIHDNYMYPRISDGDLVVTYKLDKLYSSDIVLFEIEGKKYLGRVVAVGGDTIDFNEAGYTVNGLNPYEVIYYKTEKLGNTEYPYTLKEDEVFVLCDYREQGMDSREFGVITETKGKVVFLIRGRGF